MIIPLNDKYRITSDAYQFILQQFSGKSKDGTENWRSIKYHATLEGIVNALIQHDLRAPEHSTLADGLESQKNLAETLSAALKRYYRVQVTITDERPLRVSA